MTQIGVQLHTFRDVDDEYPAMLRRVAESGYKGVEFAHEIHDADGADRSRTEPELRTRVLGTNAVPGERVGRSVRSRARTKRQGWRAGGLSGHSV